MSSREKIRITIWGGRNQAEKKVGILSLEALKHSSKQAKKQTRKKAKKLKRKQGKKQKKQKANKQKGGKGHLVAILSWHLPWHRLALLSRHLNISTHGTI